MPADDPNTAQVDVRVEVNPIAHIIAPIVAIGATMLVRKLMNDSYRKVTGSKVPTPNDPTVTLGRALMWTAMTAATAAVVEVAVYRLANQWGSRTVPND